mgnify:CR=1 FL=1
MAGRQWGNTDNSSNSVFWGVVNGKLRANSVNQAAFYNNTTPDAFITGTTMGEFGVSAAEMQVSAGPVNQVVITSAGSGYNGTVLSAMSGGGGSGANVTFSTTTGKLTGYTIVNGGSSYETNPTITVQAPATRSTNGNTNVSGDTITFANANSYYLVGDGITISANATSVPGGLTSGSRYYVVSSNTTAFKVSATSGGAAITLTKASGNSVTAGGFGFYGDTATAVAVTGGALHKGVAHAGWVVRKVGSGGRAGRVQYETLVAMGSINPDDSADDAILPNS